MSNQKKKNQKIDKSTLIEDIVENYPELVRPLKEHGTVCLACGEPVWGTLHDQAESKGITNLDDILTELNTRIDHN